MDSLERQMKVIPTQYGIQQSYFAQVVSTGWDQVLGTPEEIAEDGYCNTEKCPINYNSSTRKHMSWIRIALWYKYYYVSCHIL
jgi:hypothetical protein